MFVYVYSFLFFIPWKPSVICQMHVRDCFLLVFILFLPIYIIWRPADVRDVRIWLFVMFVSFEYLNTCYTCFLFLFSSLFNFVPLFTECHQVYEMYVAGFKFHLLNNAFTSHWGFQVQQDEVLLKTTKVNRLIIRKKTIKCFPPNYKKKTSKNTFSRVLRKT